MESSCRLAIWGFSGLPATAQDLLLHDELLVKFRPDREVASCFLTRQLSYQTLEKIKEFYEASC